MDVLISEVRKRPALWDKSHKFYRHRVYADKAWDAIAKITGISSTLAKDKWKNLRDHFKREVHKLPLDVKNDPISITSAYTGRWKYFPALMFLLEFVRPMALEKEEEFELDDIFTENDVDLEFDAENIYQDEINDCSTPTLVYNANPVSAASSIVETSSSDEADLCYLQSLLPYFKELPPLRKLQVRRQFENVLMEELASAPEETTEPVSNTIVKMENTDDCN